MNYRDVDIDNKTYFEALGFKCGLEIHQQVATEKKLFCHCPVGLTNRPHDAEILRHMRPTLSELGEYDGTALMEFKTKKEVIYRLYRDRTCTYEMDDTPPFLVNQQALDYAMRLALLFNCRIVDEVHVIRKQYLDGSIPTGFQRTMIIGVDGWVPFRGRKINITQVNLEEEACREVSDIGHTITFAADRLSTPLVEIITDCQMKNPTEATEVCRLLGNAMKITGLVRRGIGTVRQDVNVSITGSTRCEIKGVHKVDNIKALTAYEAGRHKGLLELKDLIKGRFTSPEQIPYRQHDLSSFFQGSLTAIGRRLEKTPAYKTMALLLPGMADIVLHPLQPGRDFGSELSGRVRVIACIDDLPNLFFLSQKANYNIPDTDWEIIGKALGHKAGDDIVLICGPEDDIPTAINEIKIRVAELFSGIPNETRQDMKDGTTDFERVLPGPDRMYPDTDHPPVKITNERVEKNRQFIRERLWDKQERWRKLGLHEEQVKALSLSPLADLFDRLTREKGASLGKTAHICTALAVGLRREGFDLAACDKNLLFDTIRQAMTDDWPFGRLKEMLITLQSNPVPNAEKELSEEEFNTLWSKNAPQFCGKSNGDDTYKFRRFMAGKLIAHQTCRAHDLIAKIDRRLAAGK